MTYACMTYAPAVSVVIGTKYRINTDTLHAWTNQVSDIHSCSYDFVCCVACERTFSNKMPAMLFSEPARQNAQHSCASARKKSWQIMPSLLNSVGAGHGLPDGLVEVWGNNPKDPFGLFIN